MFGSYGFGQMYFAGVPVLLTAAIVSVTVSGAIPERAPKITVEQAQQRSRDRLAWRDQQEAALHPAPVVVPSRPKTPKPVVELVEARGLPDVPRGLLRVVLGGDARVELAALAPRPSAFTAEMAQAESDELAELLAILGLVESEGAY